MLTESTLKSLGLAWSGDFESLKRFVSESLKLDGVWSQPGGDKKVFTAKDVCIIWRRNKSFLVFEGVKANELKKEFVDLCVITQANRLTLRWNLRTSNMDDC